MTLSSDIYYRSRRHDDRIKDGGEEGFETINDVGNDNNRNVVIKLIKKKKNTHWISGAAAAASVLAGETGDGGGVVGVGGVHGGILAPVCTRHSTQTGPRSARGWRIHTRTRQTHSLQFSPPSNATHALERSRAAAAAARRAWRRDPDRSRSLLPLRAPRSCLSPHLFPLFLLFNSPPRRRVCVSMRVCVYIFHIDGPFPRIMPRVKP